MTNGIRANDFSDMATNVSFDFPIQNPNFYHPYQYTPLLTPLHQYTPPPTPSHVYHHIQPPEHIFHPPQSPPSQFHRTTHTPQFDETQHLLYQNLPQSFQPAQPQSLQPYTTTPTPATFVTQIPPTGSILQQPEMYAPQVFGESPERVLAASSSEIEAARQWSAFNIECWEKLYPEWKYDQYTGQWYQVNGYDATTSGEGSFDTTVRKEATEVSYLQPISQSDEGKVEQNGTTESVTTWNQVPTGDNGYPFHMHFDPQYPGWYYDTISQEWCSLDTYIPSTPPAVQSETPMWISDTTRHQILDKCKEMMLTLETMNEILADTSRICKEISSKPGSQSPHMSTRISVIDDNDASIGNESKSEVITDEVGKELLDLKGSDSALDDVEDDSGLLVLQSVFVLSGDVAFKENGDASDGGEGFRREEGSHNRSVQMEKMGKRLADMSKPVMENTDEEITKSKVLSSDLVKQSLSTCTYIAIINNLDSLSKNEIMVSMNSEGWNQSQLTQHAIYAPRMFVEIPEKVYMIQIPAKPLYAPNSVGFHVKPIEIVLAPVLGSELTNNDKETVYKLHEAERGKFEVLVESSEHICEVELLENDFDMSDAQQEHALAVERLALKMELCPGYMSETCFWKIYFVLLHPRLDQHDAEVLSTPQIVKARSLLTQNNLRNHTSANPEQDYSDRDTPSIEEDMKPPAEEFLSAPSASQMKSVPSNISALESAPQEADIETEKHPVSVNEVQIVDKSVIKEENVVQNKKQNLPSISSSKVLGETDEDDADSSDEDAMSEDGSEDNEDNKSALDEVTPEQVKSSQKKRASVSTSKKHVPEKKANLITPEKTNGKKGSVTLLCCLGNVKQLFEGKREMYLGDKKMKIKITIQRIFDKLYLVLPNTTISVEAVKERNALWKIFLLEAKSTCIGGPLYALKCSVTKDFNQTATRAPPTLVTDPRNVTRPVDDWELLVLLHLYTSLTLQMMQFGVALTQDYMSSESIRASFMFLSSGQYAYDHVALLHQKEVWANYAKTFLSTSLRTRMVSRRGVCHD